MSETHVGAHAASTYKGNNTMSETHVGADQYLLCPKRDRASEGRAELCG